MLGYFSQHVVRLDVFVGDGTCKLFFNTAGHVSDIPTRLKELLTYMSDT